MACPGFDITQCIHVLQDHMLLHKYMQFLYICQLGNKYIRKRPLPIKNTVNPSLGLTVNIKIMTCLQEWFFFMNLLFPSPKSVTYL